MVELSVISNLLQQLLINHNRVSLPGVGAFKVEHSPATFTNEGMRMLPPSKHIYFSAAETWNDNLLEHAFAKENNCSFEEAQQQLLFFGQQTVVELEHGKRIKFPGFGALHMTMTKDFFFEAENPQQLNPDTFGLLEIEMQPLQPVTTSAPITIPPRPASTSKPTKKASSYWWIWVSGIIIVLAVCSYIFRDSIITMAEKAYYTPTEYEYVQRLKNK